MTTQQSFDLYMLTEADLIAEEADRLETDDEGGFMVDGVTVRYGVRDGHPTVHLIATDGTVTALTTDTTGTEFKTNLEPLDMLDPAGADA